MKLKVILQVIIISRIIVIYYKVNNNNYSYNNKNQFKYLKKIKKGKQAPIFCKKTKMNKS